MQLMLWLIIAAFAVAVLIGPSIIRWLRSLKFGQSVYDLGPESHMKKQGTPIMGGIIFTVPTLLAGIALLIFGKEPDKTLFIMVLVCTFGFGAIGFTDDFIKMKLHRHEGLTPKQKLLPQIVLSILVSVWAYLSPAVGSALTVPFFNVEWNLGIFFIPVMTFILVGTVNSANLLDGQDGLLSGCAALDFSTMAIICYLLSAQNEGFLSIAAFACALIGGLLGFLIFNGHPAQVFMGDVGAFLIGGALSGIMLVTRLSLLLPVIALAMLVSSLSDLIQFAYFRATHGKRIFKMAPLHHHFEKCGYPETRITAAYHIVTALLCILALIGFLPLN